MLSPEGSVATATCLLQTCAARRLTELFIGHVSIFCCALYSREYSGDPDLYLTWVKIENQLISNKTSVKANDYPLYVSVRPAFPF